MNEKDYLEFLNSKETVSEELSQKVLSQTRTDSLTDSLFFYTKLFFIFSLSGFLTFSFFPQFGLNPFNANPHLTHMLMGYGMWACGLFCGSLFMGAGVVLKFLLLSKRDLSLLPQYGVGSSLVLSSIIYAMFMIIGAQGTQDFLSGSLVFALFWILAGVILEKLSQLLTNTVYRTQNS